MKKRVLSRAAHDPEPLIDLLCARLHVSPAEAHDLVDAGAVYVEGERVMQPRGIGVGQRLTVFAEALPEAPPPLTIVHRDDWIAVVDKPPGLPSQPERSQRAHALDLQAQRTLGHTARMMHRLDKEASGLVLFALRAPAHAPLQAALGAGGIDRRYLAIVDGELRGDGTIRLRIARHARDRRLRAALPEHAPAGEPALSRYRVLGHGCLHDRPISAVELQLETGRTHQLRVHLAGIGHPIVGDEPYGGPQFERLCLHAYLLELPHPSDGRRIRVSAPMPEAFSRLIPGLTSPFT
jgi:23S rRNA pseudouridine1911/1915/1917 synthase